MTDERGTIFSPEAYAQSKMLDHSSWQKGEQRLPRLITPSDVDFALPESHGHFGLDNNGAVIFCELTRVFANWKNLKYGQRLFYENCIKYAPHCAVLCQHNIKDRIIDSRHDVIAFQIMVWDFAPVCIKPFTGNENWQKFVFYWFADSLNARRWILGNSIGMRMPHK